MITRKQKYDMIHDNLIEKYHSIIYELNDSNLKLDIFNKFFKFICDNIYYIQKYNNIIYNNLIIYINYAINLLTKNKIVLQKNKNFAILYSNLFYLKNKMNLD